MNIEQKKKFKKWLIDNNLTMQDFAKKIGFSRQYIYLISCGQRKFTEKLMKKFKKEGFDINGI